MSEGATRTQVQLPWHALDAADVAARLGTGPHGLSSEEAGARLAIHGPNALERVDAPAAWRVLLHQFTSPVIYVLLLAAAVTLALGEFVDAAVIGAVLLLNAVIGFTQERRAEASVRALMELVSPMAIVLRDGHEREVDSRALVVGDVILLESGVRVPADLRLTWTNDLHLDESLLTGESVPVAKNADPEEATTDLAERRNMAFAGSMVTTGRGRGIVVATGMATELGAIAANMRTQVAPQTPLQRRMVQFARVIGVAVAVSAAAAFAVGVLLGEPVADMFIVAVALAVAAVPEGLPIAFTITLALGVRRMAARNAVIRRLAAVETLGSTTVIGTDKTGTLTENRMTVRDVWAGGSLFRIQGAAIERLDRREAEVAPLVEHHPLYLALLAGVLTNEAEVYERNGLVESRGDPTEAALLVAAARLGIEPADARIAYDVEVDLPFESERQYSACLRRRDGARFVFVKGAPERVMAMCDTLLSEAGEVPLESPVVHAAAASLAEGGMRVLAMAYRPLGDEPFDLTRPRGLVFLGLQGLLDPPRPGVREAIAGCKEAGIRVVMITGDHGVTAAAIARELGIGDRDRRAVVGSELDLLDDEAMTETVRSADVFSRASPLHKLRIVQALQRLGHVVAVTGDGVNDAPALRAADIGIAMGRGGTDVAREAADMVLADDNFVSIRAAVEEGRVTFDNVRKVTFFLVSTGVAAVITILAAVALEWPLPMVAAQLLWLNLVTNGLQDVALAFEPGEKGVLQRPPRRRSEGLLSALLWERTAIAGLVMAAGTLALFRWELERGGSLEAARSVALTTMVLFQMFHVGNSRSETLSAFRKSPFSNPFLFLATAAALAVHVAALHLPPTQYVLGVEPPDIEAWLLMLAVASAVIAAVEVHKAIRARWRRPAPAPATASLPSDT